MLVWRRVRGRGHRSRFCPARPVLEGLEERSVPSFLTAANYTAGVAPWSVAAGDFDHHGAIDLAVADFGANTVNVLLGNGDGTFRSARSYTVGSLPESVAVGDFNGDDTSDLVVANYGSDTVSILLSTSPSRTAAQTGGASCWAKGMGPS